MAWVVLSEEHINNTALAFRRRETEEPVVCDWTEGCVTKTYAAALIYLGPEEGRVKFKCKNCMKEFWIPGRPEEFEALGPSSSVA